MTHAGWLERQRHRLGLWLLGRDPKEPRAIEWTEESVSDFWTANVKTPLEVLSFGRSASGPLIKAVRHLLAPSDRCLDFGAGSGYFVQALLDAGYRAAAYEPSDGRRAVLEASLQGRDGFLGVVRPGEPREFDVVFAAEVVEHILPDRLDETLRGLVDYVRPGGLLVVTTPHSENLELGQCNCPTCGTLFHRWQHIRSLTIDSLGAMLRPYGIDAVVTHLVEFNPAFFAALDALDQGEPEDNVMDYLRALRRNEPIRIGSENSILYIGRRAH
jgi:2-polyprenyl-3-methyl-5-hydroxy-6-metoxy-1,4-benzoquinol methylase